MPRPRKRHLFDLKASRAALEALSKTSPDMVSEAEFINRMGNDLARLLNIGFSEPQLALALYTANAGTAREAIEKVVVAVSRTLRARPIGAAREQPVGIATDAGLQESDAEAPSDTEAGAPPGLPKVSRAPFSRLEDVFQAEELEKAAAAETARAMSTAADGTAAQQLSGDMTK